MLNYSDKEEYGLEYFMKKFELFLYLYKPVYKITNIMKKDYNINTFKNSDPKDFIFNNNGQKVNNRVNGNNKAYSNIVKNVFNGNTYTILKIITENPYKNEKGINNYEYIQKLYTDTTLENNKYAVIIHQKKNFQQGDDRLNLKLFTVPKDNFEEHCVQTKDIIKEGTNTMIGYCKLIKEKPYSITTYSNNGKTSYRTCIKSQEKIIKINENDIVNKISRLKINHKNIRFTGHICKKVDSNKKVDSKWKILYRQSLEPEIDFIDKLGKELEGGKKPIKKTTTKKPVKKITTKKPVKKSTTKKPIKKTTTKKPVKKSTLKKPIKKTTTKKPVKKSTTKKPIKKTTTKKPVIKKSVKKASTKNRK